MTTIEYIFIGTLIICILNVFILRKSQLTTKTELTEGKVIKKENKTLMDVVAPYGGLHNDNVVVYTIETKDKKTKEIIINNIEHANKNDMFYHLEHIQDEKIIVGDTVFLEKTFSANQYNEIHNEKNIFYKDKTIQLEVQKVIELK